MCAHSFYLQTVFCFVLFCAVLLCCVVIYIAFIRVSAQLIEAEKTYKRASKTADTYKVQVSKLNPTGAAPKQLKFSVAPLRGGAGGLMGGGGKAVDKDLQIQLMEKELAALRDNMKNKESKACVVS